MPQGNIVGDTIEEQTRATLANCRRQLESAGCTFADVFKVNAYMTQSRRLGSLQRGVYGAYAGAAAGADDGRREAAANVSH